MHVFESLAREGRLLCPETRAPVTVRGGRVHSPAGRDLGPAGGPLNFLRDYRDTLDPASVPRADVERMRAQLDLAPGGEVDARIAEAIAATGASFSQRHLSAEARILAERFRMPAFEARARPTLAQRLRALRGLLRLARPGEPPRLDAVCEYVGDRLVAGDEVYRSIRVRNGGGALRAGRDSVVTGFAIADGTPLAATRVTTPLPVDLDEGREITLIVRLRAPGPPGRYRLRASLGGAAAAFLEKELDVVGCDLPVFDYRYFPDVLEYGADHHVAMVELSEYLAESGRKRARILEIGGGVHPTGHSIALLGHEVVSADISHSQSILGTLYFRQKMPQLDESLGFLSCDGLDLPFGDASFDGAMLVAAFHHFADPRGLLRELKRVVKPGGFVYLACETCAPNPADPQYLEELRRGINEQMWTLAEFTQMFREAGLAVARARVDGHSLKAVLTTRRPG